MTRKRLLIALAATAALFAGTLVVANSASAGGGFGERVSGDFWDTAIDSNEDGSVGNVFSGATKGKNSHTYQGVLEVAIVGPVTAPGGPCEVGDLEGDVVAYSIVRRYNNGNLLWSDLAGENSGTLCFNPGSGEATLDIDAQFIGGTGKYANATGTYNATYEIQNLLADGGGGIGHGAFWGTTSGTLYK